METRVLRFSEETVEIAAQYLLQGETVALPTETVYGLAAVATDPAAVAKIFAAKERPSFDPLIVHLPALEMLPTVARVESDISELVDELIRRFWPGPLTIVLPRAPSIPDLVTSGLETVAVRWSAHPMFQAVIRRAGKPLAAPSANRFGRISPTCAEHAAQELDGRIPLVVDGGATSHGIESTIVWPSRAGVRILRPGPIPREEFEFTSVIEDINEVRPIAPGRLESHYAPRTPLQLMENGRPVPGKRSGLLAWNGVFAAHFEQVEWLSDSGNLIEAAAHLFAALRRLDSAGLDLIVAERVPEVGVGTAIQDRLTRAAALGGNAGKRDSEPNGV